MVISGTHVADRDGPEVLITAIIVGLRYLARMKINCLYSIHRKTLYL